MRDLCKNSCRLWPVERKRSEMSGVKVWMGYFVDWYFLTRRSVIVGAGECEDFLVAGSSQRDWPIVTSITDLRC